MDYSISVISHVTYYSKTMLKTMNNTFIHINKFIPYVDYNQYHPSNIDDFVI